MGATRTENYTNEQIELSNLLKAIAHPARLALIQHLIKLNYCVNADFVKEIGLAQPTISQHLNELKNAGIIKGTNTGNSVSYCIDPDVWKKFHNTINGLFNSYKPTDLCC